jgi:hypothetical protein
MADTKGDSPTEAEEVKATQHLDLAHYSKRPAPSRLENDPAWTSKIMQSWQKAFDEAQDLLLEGKYDEALASANKDLEDDEMPDGIRIQVLLVAAQAHVSKLKLRNCISAVLTSRFRMIEQRNTNM